MWLWIACGPGWTLLALGCIDRTSFLLPDVLTLPLLFAGLVVTVTLQPEALTDHRLAAALGYLAFAGIALAYRRLRGREGLGGGDARLIAAAGAWCGLEALPWIAVGSAALELLAALGLALTGRTVTSRTRIPFVLVPIWRSGWCGYAETEDERFRYIGSWMCMLSGCISRWARATSSIEYRSGRAGSGSRTFGLTSWGPERFDGTVDHDAGGVGGACRGTAGFRVGARTGVPGNRRWSTR